jgi:predicted neuraminidase
LLPLWRGEVGPPRNPAFVIREPVAPLPAGGVEDRLEELTDPAMGTASAHVASICELPGGRLGAAWYGGTREGHQDVEIYFSIRSQRDAGGWTPPQAVVTRNSAARELRRYVRKVGNAVIFADERSLWLVYVSVAVGGWSGSSLNLKRSFDEGRTWTPSQRLTLSPMFNISELVKNKPAALVGGGWALPVYHEALGKFSELLWLRETPGGVSCVKTRMFGGKTAFQPSLVPLTADEALALCRAAGGRRAVMLSRTADAGRHWSAPQSTGHPNPDSGLDALRLFDGRLLLAFNDSRSGRENLRLAISDDNGASWKPAATVAAESGGEFSYPFLLQTNDGRVHLVYTWKRTAIKHLAFSPAWLNSRVAASQP